MVKFYKIYKCDNEFYQISLSAIIDYETYDITYTVTNTGTLTFKGEIQIISSMLGTIKSDRVLFPDETIEFKGNLSKAIAYNGEFKQDISVAYLKLKRKNKDRECKFVMSNTVTNKSEEITPESWIYSVSFGSSVLTNNESISIMNSLNSKSEAKDITVEVVYFSTISLSNISISPNNTYPEEITLEQDKFVFRIPSLLPGDIRVYRFLTTALLNPQIGAVFRVKSSTPLLFQPNQGILYILP